MKGLFIHYDRVPWPTDAELLSDPESGYHYDSFEAARKHFNSNDHLREARMYWTGSECRRFNQKSIEIDCFHLACPV
jgi:hypothetical protein|eukprot:COSAG02_NODE_5508_length_4271_cov_1.557047_2_plen_77_part_00